VHATDPSNASRTLLYDINTGGWSDELCDLLQVPRAALPEVRPSSGDFGRTDPQAFLGLDLPIAGIAGDQQAALFGQACYDEGTSKCTYGTGSFVLVNTGTSPVRSDAGLLTTGEDAWFEALASLAGDAGLRARLGAAGRERATAHYSIRRWAPTLAGLLRD